MGIQENEINAQEIWALFRETRETIRETQEGIRENRESIREIREGIRETRESIRETREGIEAMSRESRERAKEIDARFKESDERFRESDERFRESIREMSREYEKRSKETDRKINKVAGLFDTQWGKLMESLAEGGILRLFQERGIDVYQIYQRAKSRRNGRHLEIDLLLVDDTDVVMTEVKTTLKSDHVKDFLEDMAEFPEFFRRYKDCRIYGAVAALRMEQKSERFAEKQGLFVIKVGGDGMTEILNDSDFEAKNFGSEK